MTSRRGHRTPRVGRPTRAPLLSRALLAAATLAACGETRGLILGETAAPDAASGVDASAGVGCSPCSIPVTLSGQSLTSVQGGTTGTASTDTCPGDQVVIGYLGSLTPPSVGLTLVGGVQALCGELSLDANAGGDGAPAARITIDDGVILPVRGTSQESPWIQMCPAGEVVVGFSGRSGDDLDQIAFECAPVLPSNAGAGAVLSIGTPAALSAVGGDGGLPFEDLCPQGQLARGSNLRSGEWVDAFGLVCGTPALGFDGGAL
jgi:hypothetical protein